MVESFINLSIAGWTVAPAVAVSRDHSFCVSCHTFIPLPLTCSFFHNASRKACVRLDTSNFISSSICKYDSHSVKIRLFLCNASFLTAPSFSPFLFAHFFREICLYLVGRPNFLVFLSFGSYTVLIAMSQVGTDNIPSSILAIGQPDLHLRQSQIDVLPVVSERNHGGEEIQGHVQTAEPTDAKTLAEEDDEVQFVFWAPRRKKKKRKRYGNS